MATLTTKPPEKIYDNLDRSRALQAYLLAIPIVNQAGMRDSIRKFGPDNQTDVIWENLVDSEDGGTDGKRQHRLQLHLDRHPQGATGRGDSAQGPRGVNDFYYRWVVDVGITGPDKGQGGKYLMLPPGYTGQVPDGLLRREAEHLRKLAGLPQLPGGRVSHAGCRDGQEDT